MIVYPAIDLRGGRVVRLKEGDPNQQTVFSDDPVATAQQWMNYGATWLHMVNLDGAFSDENNNLAILKEVAQSDLNVQFGGGLRSLNDVEHALNLGATRVVIGTLAIEQPEVVREAVEQFGAEKICVALDARDGKIATRGWKNVTDISPVEFGNKMAQAGVIHALYTDVHRDGGLMGANIHDTITLAQSTGLEVIASGGVGTIDEIHQLAQSEMVAGVIIGMALYEGKFTLTDALQAARSSRVS